MPEGYLHPTRATIDLGAFRRNFGVVRSLVGLDTAVMAVVKANAYGHGIREMALEAVRCGAGYLGVARVEEGLLLRRAGIERPILLFEVAPPDLIQSAVDARLDLTICSDDEAERIGSAAERSGHTVNVQVKVDTGMGRLGCAWGEAAKLILRVARRRRLELVGVYSHFATAENPDQTFAREQLLRFSSVLEDLRLSGAEVPWIHMANSGAIFGLPGSYFTMVRPGLMLYGYAPRPGMDALHPLTPVMALESRVTFLKKVLKGASVSYGRKYFAARDTWIATVPIGYGDGYSRLLTGKAEVLIGGGRYAVVGTVCMDHLMVDTGPSGEVGVGADVTLLGAQGGEAISAWDVAGWLGTIPYEVTCMVAGRVERVYSG